MVAVEAAWLVREVAGGGTGGVIAAAEVMELELGEGGSGGYHVITYRQVAARISVMAAREEVVCRALA